MNTLRNTTIAAFVLAMVSLFALSIGVRAQDQTFRTESWRLGLHGGANLNSASLGWQQLHQNLSTGLMEDNFHSVPGNIDHQDGKGVGVYGGISVEYLSSSFWGVQFRISYDERNALIEDNTRTPIPSFDAKMNYLSFEPLFRIDQHLIPGLHIYAGPFIAANIHGTYTYKPDKDLSAEEPSVKVTNRNIVSYGVEGGIGYDINAGNLTPTTTLYVTPFADGSWLVNQRKSTGEPSQNSTTDIWSTTTIRVGIRLSLDLKSSSQYISQAKPLPPVPRSVAVVPAGDIVTIGMPMNNTIVTKNISGHYPILPYVFFEKGTQKIPARYIVLAKADAGAFTENDLGKTTRGDYTVQETNVNQLLVTYYQVMNIYADRMRRSPNEQLILRGCDPLRVDGEAWAMSVKDYLVNNCGIDAGRITIVVEDPIKPSGSDMTDPAFAGMIDDENRRVVFVFKNQDMLRSVPYTIRDESGVDNDMVFALRNDIHYKSWTVTFTGENQSHTYGPYICSRTRINPAPLMRGLDKGTFRVTTNIIRQDGRQETAETNITLYKQHEVANASRYLMVFDYNKSDAIKSYETRIRKEITPGMNIGNTVIVHGHTDIIGNEEGNQKLSQERSDEAKAIIDDELARENRKIEVQSIGIGQTQMLYTFNNTVPEGRMYNRNVFVEVIK